MKAILATVTVLLLSACASQPASTPQAKQSVASGTSGVSTEVWLDMMKPATASILCGPKVRLGRCFSMAEAQCEQSALSVAAKCSTLLRKNMPDVIDQSNARQWGETLGMCSVKTFVVVNYGKLDESDAECRELSLSAPKPKDTKTSL
ncbi:MAG: hypothetical protein EXR36_13170 [Betaproteobacteria bacterium]|nr:hypothetical protein [Betaproteobacteria bacterium]